MGSLAAESHRSPLRLGAMLTGVDCHRGRRDETGELVVRAHTSMPRGGVPPEVAGIHAHQGRPERTGAGAAPAITAR